MIVIALFGVTPERYVPCCHFFGGNKTFIQVTGIQKFLNNLAVQLCPLGLPVRLVGATHLRSFVPVQAQPAQRLQKLVIAFFAIALRVGIFNPEHKRAPVVACKSPVKECGPDESHMGCPGGRGAKANADVRSGGLRGQISHDSSSFVTSKYRKWRTRGRTAGFLRSPERSLRPG